MSVTPLASSGCGERPDVGRPVGSDHAPVREQLTGVFEQDDAVTQQAPALLRVAGHDVCGLPIDGLRGRALRVVVAHGAPFGTWVTLDVVSIDERTVARDVLCAGLPRP